MVLDAKGEKLARLATKLRGMPHLFDDRLGGMEAIAKIFLSPTAVFLEIGDEDGLVVGESMTPGSVGTIHLIIFRSGLKKFGSLRPELAELAIWAFKLFRVAYLNAWIPVTNTLIQRVLTDLDWHLDGRIRGFMVYNGQRVDTLVFSVTQEEADVSRWIE